MRFKVSFYLNTAAQNLKNRKHSHAGLKRRAHQSSAQPDVPIRYFYGDLPITEQSSIPG